MVHKSKKTRGQPSIFVRTKPRYQSHALRKVQRRTPGGRTVTHYEPKLHSKHICAICKQVLHGKPRGRPVEIRKLAKSERRPERPFGGMLCSKDTRMVLSYRVKLKHGLLKQGDVPISLRNYVGGTYGS